MQLGFFRWFGTTLGVLVWVSALYAQPTIQLSADLEKALLDSIQQARVLLAEYPDTTQVRILNELFEKYQPNRPDKAISFAITALALARDSDYDLGMANSLNNIGVVNKNRGNYDEALEGYLTALSIFREAGDQRGMAKTLSNMGNIYSSLGEPKEALGFFKQSDSLFTKLADTTRLIGVYNNLGNVYFVLGQIEQALAYYYRALALYNSPAVDDQSGNPFNPYMNIGQVYFARNDLDSALYYYERSLLMERSQNHADGEALALNNIGVVYQKLGDLNKALEFHNLALDLVPQLDDNRTLILIYRGLVDAYFAKGDMFLTYFYLNQESRIKDSLYTEEADRMLANVELNRLLDEKQRELDLVTKDNEIKDLRLELTRSYNVLLVMLGLTAGVGALLLYLRAQQKERISRTLEHQNEEIQHKNELIEEKNRSITEGIEYARSLQDAVVNRKLVSDCFAEAFVFYRPKDIVSGDFYFYAKTENYELLAVADCTGHGVAGAFMTVIGNALLNQLVLEHKVTDPGILLSQLDHQLKMMLRLQEDESEGRGMDIAIVRIDPRNRELIFAGAKRPLLYFQNGQQKLIKGDRFSIGDTVNHKRFMNHLIPYRAGDTFYMYSDGFTDQFGGNENKKFMRTQFRSLVGSLQVDTLDQQLRKLNEAMDHWMEGEQEQTDDMLVVGLRF